MQGKFHYKNDHLYLSNDFHFLLFLQGKTCHARNVSQQTNIVRFLININLSLEKFNHKIKPFIIKFRMQNTSIYFKEKVFYRIFYLKKLLKLSSLSYLNHKRSNLCIIFPFNLGFRKTYTRFDPVKSSVKIYQ